VRVPTPDLLSFSAIRVRCVDRRSTVRELIKASQLVGIATWSSYDIITRRGCEQRRDDHQR
jgi:hypothetical protein